jgi:hypothetical protein
MVAGGKKHLMVATPRRNCFAVRMLATLRCRPTLVSWIVGLVTGPSKEFKHSVAAEARA